jgi:hypothetical protein
MDPALALLAHEADHHAVVEHLDLQLAVGHAAEGSAPVRVARSGLHHRTHRVQRGVPQLGGLREGKAP